MDGDQKLKLEAENVHLVRRRAALYLHAHRLNPGLQVLHSEFLHDFHQLRPRILQNAVNRLQQTIGLLTNWHKLGKSIDETSEERILHCGGEKSRKVLLLRWIG